jgi:predicted kinase
MKKLFLVRGLPGSGKTTLAESICDTVVSADDYFMVDGKYQFKADELKSAHAYSQKKCEDAMQAGKDVAVANTFTKEWEMEFYYDLAERYGYVVFSLIVENRHNGVNVHSVPEDTIDSMQKRFEIKLRG